jgi:hypothetical protein
MDAAKLTWPAGGVPCGVAEFGGELEGIGMTAEEWSIGG